MARSVVRALQAVDVHEDQAEGPLLAPRLIDRTIQPGDPGAAAKDTGEVVGVDLSIELVEAPVEGGEADGDRFHRLTPELGHRRLG